MNTMKINDIEFSTYVRDESAYELAKLAELRRSIREHGLLQPITLRANPAPGKPWIIVAGRRRLKACAALGFDTIAANVVDADDERAYTIELIENLQRQDLTLGETVAAVEQLARIHGTGKALAAALAKSQPWVSKHLALTRPSFPLALREAVAAGLLSDLETVGSLAQFYRLAKTIPALMQRYEAVIAEIAAGNPPSRDEARELVAMVATLQTPPVAASAPDDDDDDNAELEVAPRRPEFAKLELAEDPARTILAALEYAAKNKPSRRPPEELIAYVRQFVADKWGTAPAK